MKTIFPYLKILFTLLVSVILYACTNPSFLSMTKCSDMMHVRLGEDKTIIAKKLNTYGVPVFAYTNGKDTYEASMFLCKDTWVEYYLLYMNNELSGICVGKDCEERIWDYFFTCSDGKIGLFGPKVSGRFVFEHNIDIIDFRRKHKRYGYYQWQSSPSVACMWAPVAVLCLPITVPSILYGELVYKKIFGLYLGQSEEIVLKWLGQPNDIQARDNLTTLAFVRDAVPTEGERVLVFVTIDEGKVIGFYYKYTYSYAEGPVLPDSFNIFCCTAITSH